MSLAEKRRLEKAKDVFKAHPDYARVVLERVYGSGKLVANLVKDMAWLRGIERCLDDVVLEHLVARQYVSHLEGRRYGITSQGLKLLGLPAREQEQEVAHG